MAEGVFTLSLEQAMRKLFFGKLVLTPDFGTAKNLIKIASDGEVFKVRELRIVKRRNFDIWAVAIRSNL